jgi:hypothetical protein
VHKKTKSLTAEEEHAAAFEAAMPSFSMLTAACATSIFAAFETLGSLLKTQTLGRFRAVDAGGCPIIFYRLTK